MTNMADFQYIYCKRVHGKNWNLRWPSIQTLLGAKPIKNEVYFYEKIKIVFFGIDWKMGIGFSSFCFNRKKGGDYTSGK